MFKYQEGILLEDGSNLEEFTNSLPNKLQEVFEDLQNEFMNGLDYSDLKNYLKIFKKYGYTFEYGLDAEPYDFKMKLNDNEFNYWKNDGNVIEVEKHIYTTQCSNYKNRLKGIFQLKTYFYNHIID
jgi:hypothetical protein